MGIKKRKKSIGKDERKKREDYNLDCLVCSCAVYKKKMLSLLADFEISRLQNKSLLLF